MKKVVLFMFSCLLVFSLSLTAFAKSEKESEVVTFESKEEKDLNKLFKKAIDKETDYKADNKNKKAIITNEKDKSSKEIPVFTTTQKLKSKKIHTGEEVTEYVTNSFVVPVDGKDLGVAMTSGGGTKDVFGWDVGLGVKAYSTIYWDETTSGGSNYKKLTRVSGGWINTLPNEYQIGTKTIRYSNNGGMLGGGWTTSQYVDTTIDALYFDNSTPNWAYISTTSNKGFA